MPRDIAPILPETQAGDDVVVLVHGFFASAGVFRPMRKRIEAETGARVASFTHLPGVGVRRIALSLTKLVDRIPRGVRVHLVGHSLGGLVARWYVEELGGHMRVAQTISLASPFGGARAADLFPYFVGADLQRESEVLAHMRTRTPADVPHTSIVGTADRIVHHSAGVFAHGEHIVLPGRGHNTLLYDTEVMNLIVARIRRLQRSNPATEAA
ncbi:hypothetical protein LVJ94_35885 [Pendulispora rubella]|uniref:Alpha/beta hydrolase n=1 Tax=Pendulispora rubella TaxID=2741070 RepID=A0ABZ2KUR4_9BACT